VTVSAPTHPPNVLRRLYAWVLRWAQTRWGTPALFGVAFAESSFFPVPPDVLQIALSAGHPRRSFFYAAVATGGSVAGGVLGWWIGVALWAAVSDTFFAFVPGVSPETFRHVEALYRENAFLAILTAAFTPIPYKVFTIASGVFGVPLATLVAASLLGRAARFFAVGACIYAFGPAVVRLLDRWFEWATLLLLVLAVAGFWAASRLL